MTGAGPAGDWPAAMARADTDLLDCLAVNLAVLLAWHGAADVRTPFAARWRFRLRADEAGNPRPDLPAGDLAEDLRELAGWELRWQPAPELAGARPAWAAACDQGRPVLVVADAYDMPWVPYAGHEHMDHSFIVASVDDAGLTIADGYANTTEWGAARPVTAQAGRAELASLLAGSGRWSVPRPAGTAAARGAGRALTAAAIAGLVAGNAGEIGAAGRDGRYDSFLGWADQRVRAGDLAPVALDSWLLARSRGLHARWLDSDAAAWVPATVRQDFAARVAAAWTRAAQMSYIGLRRARSGRAVPPAVTESLREACAAELDVARGGALRC
jgi:hypothetical protein